MRIPLSLGAEQLAAAGKVSDVAKTLDVADRTVAGWRAGKLPNRASQESMERHLGIPVVSWSRVASAPAAASAPTTSPAIASAAPPEPTARQSAEERIREQLARLREQRETPGLTERARVELEKLELQASARLARLEGASGLSLRQVMASPHIGRIAETVLDTLKDSPLELFGAIDALQLLEDKAPSWHVERAETDHPAEVKAVRDANATLVAAMKERASGRRAA